MLDIQFVAAAAARGGKRAGKEFEKLARSLRQQAGLDTPGQRQGIDGLTHALGLRRR